MASGARTPKLVAKEQFLQCGHLMV